jgi:predicted dithiol-disulfide oxidoreductase (DUF899 family)
MTEHRIRTREEWQAARKELLDRENELANRSLNLLKRRARDADEAHAADGMGVPVTPPR